MDGVYTTGELIGTLLAVLLTVAFGAWAAVVKKAADDMAHQVERAVNELFKLREEIHRDRLLNERRFSRLEQMAGLLEVKESEGT